MNRTIWDKICLFSEQWLTAYKRHSIKKKEKQKAKGFLRDWLEAFLWAAMVVFFINQYFFQAFYIPTGSMEDTLKINDRIIVNKLVYGPELLPKVGKLPGIRTPQRGDTIIFESPEYQSRGTFFEIAQRLLFMLTFTAVDLDRWVNRVEVPHFLVKRLIGDEGDIIKELDGNFYIKPPGEASFYPEGEFKQLLRLDYKTQRIFDENSYLASRLRGLYEALNYNDLSIPEDIWSSQSRESYYYDDYALYHSFYENHHLIEPDNWDTIFRYRQLEKGYYVPQGAILALGDNRDNSKDSRFFGYISKRDILGETLFRIWPFKRVGIIE